MKTIRVLVIDDSALVREVLTSGLQNDPEIVVIGSVGDVWKAREMILQYQPDVLTLDVEMPGMDGLIFLKKLMPQYPLPVIMVSALLGPGASMTLEALQFGAIDVVLKPSTNIRYGLNDMMGDLCEKIKAAAQVDVSRWKRNKTSAIPSNVTKTGQAFLAKSTDKVLVMGASTGGTVALTQIITEFPADIIGSVVVQHMPPGFTKLFSDRLNSISAVQVKEAEEGDRVLQGRILIAPGGFQTEIIRRGGEYRVRIFSGDKVNGHAPSVDVLFESTADQAGPNSIGVVLTGMGRDGAKGLLSMRQKGALTLSQDEESSLIYGMPKEAWDLGGSQKQVKLELMAKEIISTARKLET